MSSHDVFPMSVQRLLDEIIDGAGTGEEAFILNPGDPGFVRTVERLSAVEASFRNGRTTIAAHVDHVTFGLSLLNRWAAGEANPFADADWEKSWQRGEVDDATWRELQARLRQQADAWRKAVAARESWEPIAATGVIASVAHTAYHLGALRQMLAARKRQ